MRFLILDDDPEYRRVLRYYLAVNWPESKIDEVEPWLSRASVDDIDVDDYDSILLAHPIEGEVGFEWLRGLRDKASCPPVILFADPSNEFLAVDAIKAGAASFFPKSRLRYRRLIDTIRIEIGVGLTGTTGINFVNRAQLRFNRRYRFIETLHVGELSSVYLAKNLADDSRVAFKVVRHVPDTGGEDLFDRFLQEYQLIADIDHPNVVRIFDLGIADDHASIAMEYLSDGNLANRLNRPLEPSIAISYAAQIASSLVAIHSLGVIHRDLKPANIMFRADGTLAVIDFGLAKQMELEAAITDAGQIFGTPHYMSPEQGHGQTLDARSDIYSLGCIFFEMLTGRRPFVAASAMGVIYCHAHSPRPTLAAELAPLQAIIDKMYASKPDDRFPSALAVLDALDTVPPSLAQSPRVVRIVEPPDPIPTD